MWHDRWTIVGDSPLAEGYNSIADPNAVWPPPPQLLPGYPLFPLPDAPPTALPPAPGAACTRTRSDVDACSCAWHHCRSWQQRVSLSECQSECHCEYSLWTVGNTLSISNSDSVSGLANEFNAAFSLSALLFCAALRIVAWHFLPYSYDVFAHELCVFMIYVCTQVVLEPLPAPDNALSPQVQRSLVCFGFGFGFVWVSLR